NEEKYLEVCWSMPFRPYLRCFQKINTRQYRIHGCKVEHSSKVSQGIFFMPPDEICCGFTIFWVHSLC
ncbi:MAG: hypothetical protein V2I36_05495, partial [Desulfopila sp.]|nr:hypothetical protein [Desulfopila sp.]